MKEKMVAMVNGFQLIVILYFSFSIRIGPLHFFDELFVVFLILFF